MRAYHEINDFEEQMVEAGGIVTKFWLTITKEEQLRRFREREKTPHKSFRSRPKTGATAGNGMTTSVPCAT